MKTKHLPLIIGISLPIVFIIVISCVIFLPSVFIKPNHNFIYSTDDARYGYTYKNTYVVKDGHLSLQAVPPRIEAPNPYKTEAPTLYLYDTKTNTSHQVTFDEVKNYVMDPGPSSPDGYTIKYEYERYGLFELFGSGENTNGYYIEKDKGQKRLTGLTNIDRYNPGNFNLIGWIK